MASTITPRIGWIGLGNMGAAMAKNMQRHLASTGQNNMKIYNRTASRTQPIEQFGAIPCSSIIEVVEDSDIVFISTSDDDALNGIVDGILKFPDLSQKIIVDTTTVHPDTSRSVAEKLRAVGAVFVAAPCFGATPVAEAGTLLMAVAGPSHAADKITSLIKGVLARDVLRVGEEPEKASLLKTAGNFMIAGIMEIVAESLVFAEKTGLGTEMLQRLLKENFGELAYSDSRRMLEGVYMPGRGEVPWSNLDLALKDVGHGLSSAKDAGMKLDTGEVIMGHLQRAKEYSDEIGGRAMDSSSLYGVVREDAELDFETEYVKRRDCGNGDQ